jgi:hypothetical protein
MIAIASVQHTGTRFLRLMFKPQGIKNAHFGQNFLHTIDGHFILTPLRRLDRIIESWIRRDMDLKTLHTALAQMVSYPVDFYFPIDADDREQYLKRLNEILETDLATDWAPQGGQQKSGSYEPRNPEYDELIRRDYSEWFKQYYD